MQPWPWPGAHHHRPAELNSWPAKCHVMLATRAKASLHLPASSNPTVNAAEKQDHRPSVSDLETFLPASQWSNICYWPLPRWAWCHGPEMVPTSRAPQPTLAWPWGPMASKQRVKDWWLVFNGRTLTLKPSKALIKPGFHLKRTRSGRVGHLLLHSWGMCI